MGASLLSMKAFRVGICAVVASIVTAMAGSPSGAERIVKEQRLAHLEWQQQWLSATSGAEKSALMASRPDYEQYGRRMVNEIASSLQKKWSMPYIVWTLREHPTLSAKGVKRLIGFVEQSHRESPLVGEFCVSLVSAGEQKPQLAVAAGLLQEKTKFIKKAMKQGSSAQVRGQAALAMSSMLARRGDEPQVTQQRLKLIRQAIIDAADAKVGDTTVAELAREEIYRLSKLSKRATAPELAGYDAAGQPMKLSQFRGKNVILVFWSSWEQAEQVIAFTKKMQATYAGKPVEVVGVNRDSLANLRKLVAAGQSVGKSFSDPQGKLFEKYRVSNAPACYVLDTEGVIRHIGAPDSFVDFTISALLAEEK